MSGEENASNLHGVNSNNCIYVNVAENKNVQKKYLNCLYTNADSLTNKLDELKGLVKDTQPDLIGITEVKPKNNRYNIGPAELKLDGYVIFHNLEQEGRG